MRTRHFLFIVLAFVIALMVLNAGLGRAKSSAIPSSNPQTAVGTGITYQGQLTDGGIPAEGIFDFQFELYDAETDGALIGILALEDVPVTDGIFTVMLDFGTGAFDGQTRWLAIGVRPGAESGAYTPLNPRQFLSAAPYAQYALEAGSIEWTDIQNRPAGLDDGDDGISYSAGTGLSLNGSQFHVLTDTIQTRVSDVCSAGYAIRQINADGSVVCEADDDTTYTAGTGLSLSGTQFNVITSTIQQRVSNTCPVGSSIRVVKADGSVECETDDDSGTPLPTGAMVLGETDNDTALIGAGYSYADRLIESKWTYKAPMLTGRYLMAATSVNGVIYTIGGSGFVTTNEAYDPGTDSWTTKAPMLTGRQGLAVAEVGGVIYAIGGSSAISNCEATVEAYYPVTNTWVTKASMPTGRNILAAVAVDGMIYAVGGMTCDGSYETTVEAYNPETNTWVTKMDMPTGRYGLAAAAVDGVVYAVGGYSASNGYETVNEAYYPITNTWVSKAPMYVGQRYLAAVALDGMVYAIGGQTAAVASGDTIFEAYNPTSDFWTSRMVMRVGRYMLSAAVVDRVVYAIGGYCGGSTSNHNEAYLPPLYVYRKD